MIIDANILLYATHTAFDARHEHCRAWLERSLSSERVGLPWMSLLAFVRLSTSPRVFERPMTPGAAMSQVQEWLSLPNVWVPAPALEHTAELDRMVRHVNAIRNDVYDAHLAALAMEHGVRLASTDEGFSRFPVRLVNPFKDPGPAGAKRRRRSVPPEIKADGSSLLR